MWLHIPAHKLNIGYLLILLLNFYGCVGFIRLWWFPYLLQLWSIMIIRAQTQFSHNIFPWENQNTSRYLSPSRSKYLTTILHCLLWLASKHPHQVSCTRLVFVILYLNSDWPHVTILSSRGLLDMGGCNDWPVPTLKFKKK